MDKSLFDSLKESLNEGIEFAKGDLAKGTVRNLTFKSLPELSDEEIKSIREGTHLSAAAFANVLGVSVKTIESWEAGRSVPNGPSKRLLQMFKEKPEFTKEFIVS
ncbi:antitoxin HigA-2 [Saccharibacillus endophyticus]|uniref:Antitoxin HigA-2 n=2 Tax=Saccharibacillus endophyticus TaxID=2060666 RepID=A0ABQ1ZYK6_9BACL|nr:antitoxin HigA-2 [Saccharibacillus endophyticus]